MLVHLFYNINKSRRTRIETCNTYIYAHVNNHFMWFFYISLGLSLLSFLSRCPRWCSLYVLVSMGKTAAWNRFIRSSYFIAFEKCLREKTTKSNSTFYIDLHLVSYKHQTQFREYEKKSFSFFFGCQNIDAM